MSSLERFLRLGLNNYNQPISNTNASRIIALNAIAFLIPIILLLLILSFNVFPSWHADLSHYRTTYYDGVFFCHLAYLFTSLAVLGSNYYQQFSTCKVIAILGWGGAIFLGDITAPEFQPFNIFFIILAIGVGGLFDDSRKRGMLFLYVVLMCRIVGK